jgi:hypothetical protein
MSALLVVGGVTQRLKGKRLCGQILPGLYGRCRKTTPAPG